jgi:hypothetical protein|nr:MAG TPA: hypothetical protein [Bacteriophage sp.]
MEWEDFNEKDINWPIKKGEKVYHYLYGWGEVTDYYVCNVRWWRAEIGVTFEGENKTRWFNPIGKPPKCNAWMEDIRVELSKTKYTKLEDLPSLSKEEYSKKMNSLLNEEGEAKEVRNEEYLKMKARG